MIMRIIVNYFKYIQRSSKIQVYDVVGIFYSFIKITTDIIFRKVVVEVIT